MPILLTSIPGVIAISIVQTLNLSDFLNFHQSSQDGFHLAMKVNTRFSMSPRSSGTFGEKSTKLYLASANGNIGMEFNTSAGHTPYRTNFCEYPVRFENYKAHNFATLTEEFCVSLISIITCTNSTIKELSLYTISCSPDTLVTLIEAAKIKKIQIRDPISPVYMHVEEIRKILKQFTSTFMDEYDILTLNADYFTIRSSNITSAGINQLLKKLLAQNESFERFEIDTNQPILKGVILAGIRASFRSLPFHSWNPLRVRGNRYNLSIKRQRITVSRKGE